MENTEDALLLVIEVEYDDGCAEHVAVHEGDDPKELASSFASNHDLAPEFERELAEQIQVRG